MTMSGSEVWLPGPAMDDFIASLQILAGVDPVIVGGLAVMSRIGGEHRVTRDIDSTFDRPGEPPTVTLLVADGIAEPGDAIQRVRIGRAIVDVIDTFEIDEGQLPDDPKGRLFVCAHRYAWETGTEMTFVGDTNRATVSVATVDALIAMKAHALRFARPERRVTKRASDLYDVLRLSAIATGPLLADAPWSLAAQVKDALSDDLADRGAATATLRSLPGADLNEQAVERIVDALLSRLG